VIDYCENAVFIDEMQRSILNGDLDHFTTFIRDTLAERNVQANVYLCGSLARRNPALCWREDGTQALFSDLDFVIAVPKSVQYDEWLINLGPWLCRQNPSFNSSVFYVVLEHLPRLRSGMARDLEVAMEWPIYEPVQPPQFGPDPLTKEDAFELLIYQLSGFFLHPALTDNYTSGLVHFRSDVDYHYIKFALECLRAQFEQQPVKGVVTYTDIYNKRYDPALAGVIEPEDTASFVKAREFFGRVAPPRLNVVNLLERATMAYFDLKPGNHAATDLLEPISRKLDQSRGVLELYRMAMLSLILSLGAGPTQQLDFLSLFSSALRRVDPTGVPSYREFVQFATGEWSGYLEETTLLYRKIMNVMRSFRVDYLSELGARNVPDEVTTQM